MSDMFKGAPDPSDWSDDEAIQRALISEHAADATYQDILARTKDPRVKATIAEIIEDEQNHQGRLQMLLSAVRGGDAGRYAQCFAAGLAGKENP